MKTRTRYRIEDIQLPEQWLVSREVRAIPAERVEQYTAMIARGERITFAPRPKETGDA